MNPRELILMCNQIRHLSIRGSEVDHMTNILKILYRRLSIYLENWYFTANKYILMNYNF